MKRMRKIFSLVLYCMCFGSYFSQAQSVDGIALEEIESTYVQISIRGRFFSPKIRVLMDFGQDISNGRINESLITDEQGKALEFNSLMDVLNFFDRLGYEYLDRGHVGEDESVKYLLRRKKEEMDLANSPLRRD